MIVRVAFLGNDPWSVPTLEALAAADDIRVDPVVTNPPRPAGRGSRLRPTSVSVAADSLGLRSIEVAGMRDGAGPRELRAAAPDVLVVVAYGELLGPDVLRIAPLGAINLHFSLLPRWRGAAPVQRALLAGDLVTGVSAMLMDEGLDTGPVLAIVQESIGPDDDAGSLGMRLAHVGGRLVVEVLRSLAAGTIEPLAQDPLGATAAPKLDAGERRIDWEASAEELARRVRALAPEPAASTRFGGVSLKVQRVETVLDANGPRPGVVLAVDKAGVMVAAGSGAVRLLEVAAQGRRRMPAAEWARGARIAPGDVIG